jgi:DNA-binding transcriptional MerR regulator
MKKAVFEREELCRRLGIDGGTLDEWQDNRIFGPFAVGDNRTPLYTESAVAAGEQIKKLKELGYGTREIRKIIRKIGLPRSSRREDGRPKTRNFLTVGALAEKVGVSARTIKHWEDMGIIEPNMRSEGGFRYYSDAYIYLCNLVTDLQRFGYSLTEIKMISDLFRYYLAMRQDAGHGGGAQKLEKLDTMLHEIERLSRKMGLLKAGIRRWEDLLKKKRKDVAALRLELRKRMAAAPQGGKNAKDRPD